jgi:hypothetical protein
MGRSKSLRGTGSFLIAERSCKLGGMRACKATSGAIFRTKSLRVGPCVGRVLGTGPVIIWPSGNDPEMVDRSEEYAPEETLVVGVAVVFTEYVKSW